jgi:hypothetical protein
MIAVEMLPGGNGDALVVEYGTDTDTHQLLIDAGTYHAWNGVRKELIRRDGDRYEIFVVTHVDEDHIGGAIAVLDDPDLSSRVGKVWFNGFVHCESGGNVLGPVNGEQLTQRIVSGPFEWNQGFTPNTFPRKASAHIGGPVVLPSNGDLLSTGLPGGARVVLLSPSGPKLKAMAEKWKKDVTKAGIGPGGGTPGHTWGPAARPPVFEPLPNPLDRETVKTLAAKKNTDGSRANGSSIAFVLEYGGKRVLFGADAHAPQLTGALQRYARRVREARPRFDLVKLSHHGSNANLSTAMLQLIDCRRFLISTNGERFDHPDHAAIAKVIAAYEDPVTFYCNYRTVRTEPWEKKGPAVGGTFKFPKAKQHFIRVTA